MRIGIFDSGLGGINVLKEMIKVHPNESYVYIGDNKNVPYGNKSMNELYILATKIIDKLIEFDVDIVIVACGTISSTVYDKLQNYCSVPIVNIVATTIDYINKLKIDSIAVMATPNTIKSHIFKKNLKSEEVYEVECKDLASIIENNTPYETKKLYIEKYLSDVKKWDIKNIVLGCTHYPLVKEEIQKYLNNVVIFDMGIILAQHFSITKSNDKLEVKVFFTYDNENIKNKVNKILNFSITTEQIDL